MTIANGERDVNPDTTEIVIRFDRTTRTDTYAVARTSAIEQPKMGKVGFDPTGRVFTIPVTLEADKEYAFSLNWPGGGSFQTQDGILLKPVEVRFRTRAKQ